nr:hypothetical protein [Devosia sp. A16]
MTANFATTRRHADLEPYLKTIASFLAAMETDELPRGSAANDNCRHASVVDVNPAPMRAEDLLGAFDAGAIRFAATSRRALQFVRGDDGELEPRSYVIPAGAITHVWGDRVTQDAGRVRKSEAKSAVTADRARLDWFCVKLRAVPPARPKRVMSRRKPADPIDWGQFSHVRGNVPLDEARAACGLPPIDRCPLAGLPWEPDPENLFVGMVAGRGSRRDGARNRTHTRRPDPESYVGDAALVDRLALEQFRIRYPAHYAVLESAMTACSMGDLVGSNDHKSGKRKWVAAAEALQEFLAA